MNNAIESILDIIQPVFGNVKITYAPVTATDSSHDLLEQGVTELERSERERDAAEHPALPAESVTESERSAAHDLDESIEIARERAPAQPGPRA